MNKIDFKTISELEDIVTEEKEILNMLTLLLNNYFDKKINVEEHEVKAWCLLQERDRYSSLANSIYKQKKENLKRLEKLYEELHGDYLIGTLDDIKK